MPLPVLIPAAASVAVVLGVIAKYVQAFFQAVQTALFALYAWYQAHKIIFSLALFAAMVAAWASIGYLFSHYSAVISRYVLFEQPSLSFLGSGVAILGNWVDMSLVSQTLGVVVADGSGVLTVHSAVFARRLVFTALTAFVRTFKG